MGDVQRPDVARLHQSISKAAPIEANRVLALVSHLFTKAEEWGYVPAGHPNPARGVQKSKERARDRWLKEGEVRTLMRAVSVESDPYVQGAILLYLLTGLRKTELLAARWVDVDLDRRELRLPDTKSGRPHVIHLSAEAAHVFRMLPRQQDSPWVFPGRFDGHRKDIKGQWERVRGKAGLADVRLHDLRRTVGSWLAQQGTSLQVIGKILNHSHPGVTAVYARLADEQSREAMDVLGAKMGEVLQLPSIGATIDER
ncbi:MAG: site-specific integrase [Chloroflexi bacterium]|nr:site-specific integrase [Chloroflexota bacterium]